MPEVRDVPLVFLSHASDDRPVALQVCAAIESRGVKVWMAPRDIPAGTDYAASIIRALNSCRVMVLLFSKKSNESSHVVREVERAANHGAPIVPFRLVDITPSESLEYFLSSRQWLDAFPGPISPRIAALADAVADLDVLKQPEGAGPGQAEAAGGAAGAAGVRHSGTTRTSSAADSSTRGSKTIPIAIGAVVVIAAVAVALFFALRGGGGQTTSASPALTPAATTSVPVEAPAPPPAAQAVPVSDGEQTTDAIRLSVTATPAEAKIFVDGVEAPGNPVSLRFRKDGLTHTLRLTAPGFVEKTRMVEFTGDITLDIALAVASGEQPAASTDAGDTAGASRPPTVRSTPRDASAAVEPPSSASEDATPAEAATQEPRGFREVDLPPTPPVEPPLPPVEDNPYRDAH